MVCNGDKERTDLTGTRKAGLFDMVRHQSSRTTSAPRDPALPLPRRPLAAVENSSRVAGVAGQRRRRSGKRRKDPTDDPGPRISRSTLHSALKTFMHSWDAADEARAKVLEAAIYTKTKRGKRAGRHAADRQRDAQGRFVADKERGVMVEDSTKPKEKNVVAAISEKTELRQLRGRAKKAEAETNELKKKVTDLEEALRGNYELKTDEARIDADVDCRLVGLDIQLDVARGETRQARVQAKDAREREEQAEERAKAHFEKFEEAERRRNEAEARAGMAEERERKARAEIGEMKVKIREIEREVSAKWEKESKNTGERIVELEEINARLRVELERRKEEEGRRGKVAVTRYRSLVQSIDMQ